MEKKYNRLQLELPDQSMERLKALKEKTEAVSYVEVIRNALRLYEALISEADAEKTFLVRDADGKTSEIKIFR